MRRMPLGLVAGLALGLFACATDARKSLVTDLVAFAQAAPYDVRVERDESHEHLAIIVQDTALARYTSLVERLAGDSVVARRNYYATLADFLFKYASLLEAAPPVYAGRDTLEVRVSFQRPDSQMFARQVGDWVGAQQRYLGPLGEAMQEHRPVLDEAMLRREWAARYARARRELREPDTLIVRFDPKGRLLELTTAGVRSEVAGMQAKYTRQRAHTRQLLPALAFRRFERSVYDQMVSLSGTVSTGSIGWWPAEAERQPATYDVECRVVGAGDTVVGTSGVTADERLEADDFICMWLKSDARRIREMRSAKWEVRVRESTAGDSALTSGWISVP